MCIRVFNHKVPKLQRELEEQMGVNEQLQGQLNSLKKGLRWVEVVAH